MINLGEIVIKSGEGMISLVGEWIYPRFKNRFNHRLESVDWILGQFSTLT